jgi:TrmH family RNA methyltransferase
MPFKKITSLLNPHVKQIVKLRDRKTRDKTGLTLIEGYKEVACALRGDFGFQEVYVCPELIKESRQQELVEGLKTRKSNFFEVTKEILNKVSYGNRQEGVLAVGEPRISPLKKLSLKKNPLLVIVEGVEKPGNLGAILRTCDGAGVDALIVVNPVTDIYNPNVIRASLGTIFSIPIAVSTNEEVVQFLEEKNIITCAAVPHAEVIYTQADLSVPLAIAVGREDDGLTEFWKERADVQLRIPMNGKADSLNVSATAAIIVYEALRQRTR